MVAKTIRLGDAEVPRIGLGTNRLTHTPEHVELIRKAVAAGLRHIDTAHTYTGGDSETTIGEAAPEDAVVATKGGYRPGTGSPEQLRAQVDESLRRLRTDSIALYYLHRVDPETPLEQSLGALAEYMERGQIRHLGLSEVSVQQIEQARLVVPVTAVQNRYSLAERRWDDVVDHCEREGIVFVPFFPLRDVGGPELDEIAKRRGATSSQVALAWLIARSPAMLPIPGTLSLGHLRENLGALELELSGDELDALTRT